MLSNLGTDKVAIEMLNDSTMAASWLVQDIYGQPALSLTIDVQRTAFLNVQDATVYMSVAVLAAGLGNFFLMLVFRG